MSSNEKMQHINEEKTGSVFTLNDFSSKANLTEKGCVEDEYDPFAHRDQVKGNSTSGSLAHLLKSSLGSGILAMPMAFKNAGLLFGMMGTIIAGLLCTHCVHILVRTSQRVCKDVKRPALGFAETAEEVLANGPKRLRPWANFAKQFVDYSLMATYYAACAVYTVFIATSIHDVVNFDLGLDWNIRIYIAISVVPLLFIGQIRQLKYLVPFSAMANVLIVVTLGITLYYMFNTELTWSDKPLFSSFNQLPLFFATVVFAMEGIGVVMPVENEMKKPQHFLGCPGVLNVSMSIVIGLYAIIGFFGYVRYGDEVAASITLSLEKGEILADVAKILMAVAIIFTFGLQFHVPNEILWKKVGPKVPEHRKNITQIALRTGIVLILGGVAAAVPELEPFIGLVGAIFFSILGFLVPAVVETIYRYPDDLGRFNWVLVKNIALGVFAIFALVSGATVSIIDIISIYK